MWNGKDGLFESYVSLRVYGKGLVPQQIGDKLKIRPCHTSIHKDSCCLDLIQFAQVSNGLMARTASCAHGLDQGPVLVALTADTLAMASQEHVRSLTDFRDPKQGGLLHDIGLGMVSNDPQ